MEQHVAVSSWLQNNPSESHLDPAMCQLSHLEVVASTPQGAQGRASPVILAIRSYLPPPDSPYQDVQSVIDRWEIVSEKKPSLHPAFENLGSRRASVVGDPLVSVFTVKRDTSFYLTGC
jgi:mediator of RNA polymerase II transcription subunit 16